MLTLGVPYVIIKTVRKHIIKRIYKIKKKG
nr:MAG TPA: hypothetical protein [Caudoviricetes sp.]DAY85757.1 MAG TPA: hypothetical protein [Caudoviricetes sp.]